MTNVLEWLGSLFGRANPAPTPGTAVPVPQPLPAESGRMSVRGVDWLAAWEEYRERPYTDAAGVLTWGYGHAQQPGEVPPVFIEHAAALRLFRQDLAPVEAAIARLVTVNIAPRERDALIAFAFNVGWPAFAGSSMLKLLNGYDFDAAAREFPKWCMGGRPLRQIPGLVRRRDAERMTFLYGTYPEP